MRILLASAANEIDKDVHFLALVPRFHPVNLGTGNPECAGIECLNRVLHLAPLCWATYARNLRTAVKEDADVAAQADDAKSLADPMRGRLGRARQESGRDAMPAGKLQPGRPWRQ